jgi:hypothetical protein
MSAPSLEHALLRLKLAYGALSLPDWQAHAAAVADAVQALTDLLLHVDAHTGRYHLEPIYLDTERVVLGMIPAAVAPLLRLLERQTAMLDLAIDNGWLLPPAEAPAWAHWHERLRHYVAALEHELGKPQTPSEFLWRQVTAPLIQGIYPASFDKLGIANPKVPSRPDVATVPTTAFMVALQSQEVDRVQTWLLRWREDLGQWVHDTREAIRSVFAAAGEGVRSGVRRAAGVLTVVAVLGGLTWAGVSLASSHRRDRQRLRETSR